MFQKPFSFEGRIRRTEYGMTFIIYLLIMVVLGTIDSEIPFVVFSITLLWLMLAQGAKRCHDIGQSGWFQIIPFYFLWMLFFVGQNGSNSYGHDPKSFSGRM